MGMNGGGNTFYPPSGAIFAQVRDQVTLAPSFEAPPSWCRMLLNVKQLHRDTFSSPPGVEQCRAALLSTRIPLHQLEAFHGGLLRRTVRHEEQGAAICFPCVYINRAIVEAWNCYYINVVIVNGCNVVRLESIYQCFIANTCGGGRSNDR